MTLEERIDQAIALLAAAMKKSGMREGSGFIPNSSTRDPQAKLDEFLASQQEANKPAAKRAA